MDVCMINKKRHVNQTNRSRLNINGAITMCDSAKLSNHDTAGSFYLIFMAERSKAPEIEERRGINYLFD